MSSLSARASSQASLSATEDALSAARWTLEAVRLFVDDGGGGDGAGGGGGARVPSLAEVVTLLDTAVSALSVLLIPLFVVVLRTCFCV